MAGGEAGDALGACAACGGANPDDGRLCARCGMTADGLTPALDLDMAPSRASGKFRSSRIEMDPDVRPPGTVLGAYRIEALIGQGGIGHVYLAEHVKLGRAVAIKMLRSQYGKAPAIVHRFFAEARAANRIAHENIVQITDFVEDEQHGSYIVMELLEGTDLDDLIEEEGALPVRRILHVMTQVASALGAAQRSQIVHRDLKPENIFLIRRGDDPDFVKLLDFGVAKLTGDPGAADGLSTADGAVVGTPAYMSPEQARGRAVDYRTDVYSFGVILYELLTGALPFEATTLGDFIIKHSTEDAKPPSECAGVQTIPSALEDLTLRCLRKNPDERPASMHTVERELRAIAADEAPSLELPVVRPAPPKRRGLLAPILGGAALVLGLAGAGAWAFWPGSGAEESVPTVAVAAPEVAADVAARPPGEPEGEPELEAEAEPDLVAPPPEIAPEPEKVRLSFVSDPAGATVSREGIDEPLGVTPLTTTVPRSEETATFELRLEGRPPIRQDVRLDGDSRVQVVLPPPRRTSSRARRRARPRRRPHSRRNDVIDPFE